MKKCNDCNNCKDKENCDKFYIYIRYVAELLNLGKNDKRRKYTKTICW